MLTVSSSQMITHRDMRLVPQLQRLLAMSGHPIYLLAHLCRASSAACTPFRKTNVAFEDVISPLGSVPFCCYAGLVICIGSKEREGLVTALALCPCLDLEGFHVSRTNTMNNSSG